MPKDHATASASGSHRWLTCTKSLQLETKFPATTSVFAEEGTVAHELCELTARYFLGELSEPDYENNLDHFKKSYSKYFNPEMQEHACSYSRFILAAVNDAKELCPDPYVALETRLDFSEYVPEGFGTGDCVIVADDVLQIIDFKYGRGARVEAEDNSQMQLYALGALKLFEGIYDIKSVKMTIYQPRIPDGVTSAEESVETLIDWGLNYVRPRAELALAGEGEYAPSEKACRFCRAKAQCKARADSMLKALDPAPDPDLITVEEAGAILEKVKDAETWISDLRTLVAKSLEDGKAVPGWKLVEGRSVRKITDMDAAIKAMTAAGYEEALLYKREPISLTQMEKDFGKANVAEILAEFIVKPKGSPALAPASDRRKAWAPDEDLLNAFDEI